MKSQDERPDRALFLVGALPPAELAWAHREALRVVRPGVETAHIDAYSDDAWPQEAAPFYEQALAMGRNALIRGGRSAKGDSGMGIDIDVHDDAEFEILLALAPYTIHTEGWRGRRQIFSASDTGTSLWVAVTGEQQADLLARLAARGIPTTAFAVRPEKAERRPRWLWYKEPRAERGTDS
ncbi:hypothetical protein ABZ726_08980 [Streptomyces hundungensis]|uniref:hypothetical protein n=1 Tax=Streptomyces hundungensis TaxID=1077946 RepID=UPI0033D856F3